MDRDIINSGFDGIFFDDQTALFRLTDLLLREGHRNIKALIGQPDHIISEKRVQGIRDAFDANNIPFSEEILLPGQFSLNSAHTITTDLIRKRQIPSAFLCISNMLSYGCLKALFEYHISIPEEVAFAGYDKLEMLDILQR